MTKMRKVLQLLLATLALAMTFRASVAQEPRDKCGTLEISSQAVERLTRYFTDDEYEDLRGAEIVRVPPEAPRGVVTNNGVCNHAVHAALRMLSQERGYARLRELGYTYRVLRFGDYYAVLVKANSHDGTVVDLGWSPLLIFAGREMRYVAVILT